ncbi:MBOAT family protein [Leptolyngbyaceae cyanobacterium CCMR0082]|uniref:MBOAT family protein n=2 Tax=Adonisia turfae TaxID=2950184 RepID=A0A6M0S8B1_9CYAN|nr:MBOAT family protein [Adonisia turfae]MDV3351262.1 MBOAT family protein [Leptothoe sp. LEGE 181152]NEZ59218.1 MBOAT family protein [Adonisia turfae CCMR0081]NEZ64718.1 MBOAT family protein [Adonisia turfae CCMR0082]
MTLPSITYGLLILGTSLIYWLLPGRGLKLWLLLLASLIFYSSLQVQYVPLLLGLVLTNYLIGRRLSAPLDWRIPNEEWHFAQQDWDRKRLILLWVGISLNVLLLLGFKYFFPMVATSNPSLQLLMPLGLSFFCFESIAYLVDIYRGAPAASHFIEFASYKLFFPKLIAGPITRFQGYISQLKQPRLPNLEQGVEAGWLIASGAAKKMLLADRIGLLVNLSFDNLERAGSGDIWLAIFAYGLQLYLDFSGYVDIARGSALLFGIQLPQNFDFPYFTTSIAEFWRRWHITLGDWLRNYLYFPLGGSRKGLMRTCLNLLFVMLVAGIWHGDQWGFLVWGGLHGMALVIHRLNQTLADTRPRLKAFWGSWLGVMAAWAMTQLFVFLSWVPFRLPNLADVGLVANRFLSQAGDVQFAQKVYLESLGFSRGGVILILLGVAGIMALLHGFKYRLKLQISWPLKLMLIPAGFYLAWLLAPDQVVPYIYFEF